MINISMGQAEKMLDKKFTGCVLLAIYKKPISFITIFIKGNVYYMKFSYKHTYQLLTYSEILIKSTNKKTLISIIENDITKLIGDVEIITRTV